MRRGELQEFLLRKDLVAEDEFAAGVTGRLDSVVILPDRLDNGSHCDAWTRPGPAHWCCVQAEENWKGS